MKKVLFVANHAGFSKFNAPYFDWFKSVGWEVHNASPGIEKGNVDRQFDIDIQRNPFSLKNIRAYKELKSIIELNNYDIIHVHTPMGAVLGRLAAISSRKRGTKIIYTVHGFHFYKGAPLKSWLIYCSIELFLSRYTDVVVTINDEDYEFAKRHTLANGKVFKIDGVGVDLSRFSRKSDEERAEIRMSLGLSPNDFVCLYIGQFIPRKNHEFIIRQLPELKRRIKNLKFIFVGKGETFNDMNNLTRKLSVDYITIFLGGRTDVDRICNAADVHVSSSLQEGLAIGNIEAMATGCGLVLSDIRGHREVCTPNRNGFLFSLKQPKEMVDAITTLANYPPLCVNYWLSITYKVLLISRLLYQSPKWEKFMKL